jgi:hypothetical protein
VAELRLLLMDRLGPRWYCDPDEFPVSHGDELSRMRERWPELLQDASTLAAILEHEHLPPISGANLTDDQRLDVYRLWKIASSVSLELIGNGRYRFDYLAQPKDGAAEGTRTAGIITETGEMTFDQQAPAGEPICPICLARGTPIDTPAGPVAVDRLRLGDPVWTLDRRGRRVSGTVVALGSIAAPRDHRVIRVVLADGRTATASARHPLTDGRRFGDLAIGGLVDGSEIVGLEALPYGDAETFDLAVSGDTGTYFAGGIPLASTIGRN